VTVGGLEDARDILGSKDVFEQIDLRKFPGSLPRAIQSPTMVLFASGVR